MDDVERLFRGFSLLSYGVLIFAMVALFGLEPGSPVVSTDVALIAAVGFSLLLSTILLIGWKPSIGYPFSSHRAKAMRLWLLSTPPTLLAGYQTVRLQAALPTQIAVYVLMFVQLTTVTFGHFPWVGGAFKEYPAVEERALKIRRGEGKEGRPYESGDRVLPFHGALCEDCLTAIMPDDDSCWRCSAVVRWQAIRRKFMFEDPTSVWRRRRARGRTIWDREWHLDRFGPDIVWGLVFDSGDWEVMALFLSEDVLGANPVKIKSGRSKTLRRARREVVGVVEGLDLTALR